MALITTEQITIALAGNPNAGKTTLFNALTGMRQHTGNWPGVTVAAKEGARAYHGRTLRFVDLPGTYSLAAYSPDEIAARDFIVEQQPDVVICVVDASNLERNLYLAVQLLELGVPIVIALNMADQAKAMGIEIDRAQLSRLLGGVPVVATVASRGDGVERLLAAAVRHADDAAANCPCCSNQGLQIDYGPEIERALSALKKEVEAYSLPLNGACPRWLSLKLLEEEPDLMRKVNAMPGGAAVAQIAHQQNQTLQTALGDDVDILAADQRYRFVSQISRQCLRRAAPNQTRITDRIDNLVTHRLAGLPIFMGVMFLMFQLVINVSEPFLDWVDGLFAGPITHGVTAALTLLSAPDWLHSLVVDGAIAGVGGILTFVPGLIVLYFFLALLEDSGYMARAAFVMDRLMQAIGLHGKSVIPLILGFGCAVPAVYATRTIANRRDRLLTALLIPFMSCSARLPVYVVFAMAFFGAQAGSVIWLLYALGVAVAILMGIIFSRTFLKPTEDAVFVMELPPYRLPTLKALFWHTWDNTREFVKKAGTVILGISVVLWFLLNLPWGVMEQRDSYYGQVSAAIAPALEPAGFGNWESAGALVTGFIAKELVVSSLAQIYTGDVAETAVAPPFAVELRETAVGLGQAFLESGKRLLSLLPGLNLSQSSGQAAADIALSQALRANYTPLAAFAFLVFVLLYIPCVATVSAIKQEFGWRWAAASAGYQTAVAWGAAVLVFQGGRLLGF